MHGQAERARCLLGFEDLSHTWNIGWIDEHGNEAGVWHHFANNL